MTVYRIMKIRSPETGNRIGHLFQRAIFSGLVLLVMIVLSRPQHALGEQTRYNLNDCYRMALDRAEKIAISKEDRVIAEYLREKALSVLIPRVSAVSSYRRYSEEKMIQDSVIQPGWDAAWGVTVGQQFTLNGREITGLRMAEDGIKKSQYDLNTVKEAYLLAVAATFFDVAKVHRGVEIADANVQRLETYRNAVNTRLKLAEVTKTELFRTEAELSQAVANRIRVKNLLLLALAELARLTGAPGDFRIDDIRISADAPVLPDLAVMKEKALQNRAELKSLAMQEKIAANQIRYNKGAYFPSIGVEGAWMRMGQDPSAINDESIYFGIKLDVPIYDGGLRRAEVGEAEAQLRQVNLARSDQARQIEVEVEQAWLNLSTQQSVITSFESQLLFARENYEAVTRLSQHGMANSVDVMDANTTLVTAERELAEAQYNLRLADLQLKRAGGILLMDIEDKLKDAASTEHDAQPSIQGS